MVNFFISTCNTAVSLDILKLLISYQFWANGTISLIGNLSGSVTEINLPLVFMKCARLIGVAVGHRDSFEDMVRAMSSSELAPVVDERVYAFGELRQALEALPEGKHFGKIVIDFAA